MILRLLFTLIGLLTSYSLFAASGGPDAYGYVWTDSNEPGGPTYNWVDISTTGTLVTGLGDDNSAAAVSMGMNFHYYWGDYNQLKIGSNGWLSFENTSNIAHCFPLIPTAGGSADNYLAPFMSDLNLTGVGNIGEVYYEFDAPNDRFIVSYLNVPWWTANAPSYVGSNSFQVIFNNSDSSIVFQYENISAGVFNNLTTCSSDVVIGIEGPTGTLGLTAYVDALPPSSNYAIRFAYPNPVLLQVPDISAKWNSNVQSGGEFYNLGTTFPVLINVASVGNADVTSSVGVNVVIRNIANANVGSFNATLSGGLDAGTDTTFSFDWTPPYVGQFKVETTISNSSDINSTNNARTTELEVINQQVTNSRISYVSGGNANTGTLLWTSGANQGSGIFIEPPSYPFYVDSIGAYIVQLGTSADITLELYAADGPNNSPGTLLHSEIIPSASVTVNGWVRSAIPNPAIINSNGMYIAWKQPDATNLAIGVSTEIPLSRRGYEFLGSWAEYRDNELQELMLEAFGFSVCAGLDLSTTNVQHITCFGDSTGSINMTTSGGVPGSSGYAYSWTNYSGNDEDPTNLGAGTYQVTVTDSLGCTRTNTVIINQPTEINISVVSIQDVLCIGGISGAIDTDVSGGTPGTSGYTYSWTNYNGITGDASGIGAGSYTLTVTDENGCSVQETIIVNEPSAINVAAIVTDEMSGGDGAIDLTVTGGVGPYQYSWTNGAGTVEDPSNLNAGTYIVTVTDANGCVKTYSVTVGSQVGLSENNADQSWSIYPNPTNGEFTVDLSEASVKNGLLEVKDLSGRLIYSNEFSTDLKIQLNESGIYFVTIFNELGKSTKEIVVH